MAGIPVQPHPLVLGDALFDHDPLPKLAVEQFRIAAPGPLENDLDEARHVGILSNSGALVQKISSSFYGILPFFMGNSEIATECRVTFTWTIT